MKRPSRGRTIASLSLLTIATGMLLATSAVLWGQRALSSSVVTEDRLVAVAFLVAPLLAGTVVYRVAGGRLRPAFIALDGALVVAIAYFGAISAF